MRVHVTGKISYRAEGQRYSQPAQFRELITLDSTVDLTKEPPVYVPKQP
ncbi:MAG: hypothetical protein J2P17_29830 [Mycobacterium sp.]|nr:hypothetical protein [Mycobacterium sp.]